MKTFSDIIEKNNSYTDYYNEEPSIRKSDALKATKEAVTVALELIVMKQSCIYPAGLAYDEIMSVLDKMEGIK